MLTVCEVCNQPFGHYTRVRRMKNGEEHEVKHELITCHPVCNRDRKKMERINRQIIRVKKVLHDLRAEQLNLNFQMYVREQCKQTVEMDEVFIVVRPDEEAS